MRSSPELTVHLEAAPQDKVVAGVVEGRFDLGIADHKPDHPRLDARHLWQEELCLVLPADNATSPTDLQDLDDLGFVAHPDGFAYADELFSLNFPETFKGADHLRLRTFVNQISQIPAPVSNGIGYTILPRSGVAAFAEKGSLRIAELPARCHRDLWIVYRRGRVLPARVIRIMDSIHATASDLGGRINPAEIDISTSILLKITKTMGTMRAPEDVRCQMLHRGNAVAQILARDPLAAS